MPEQLPQWNAVGVEPPQSLKDSGWQPGMKPSAQHMNWLLNRAYKCIKELQQAGGNVDDLTQAVESLEKTVGTHLVDYVKHPACPDVVTLSGATYVVTLDDPTFTDYIKNMGLVIELPVSIVGSYVIKINNLGAKNVIKLNGLPHKNPTKGAICSYRYSPTAMNGNGAFILQGEGGSGNAQPSDVRVGKTFTNDDREKTGTLVAYGLGETIKALDLVGRHYIQTDQHKPFADGQFLNSEIVTINGVEYAFSYSGKRESSYMTCVETLTGNILWTRNVAYQWQGRIVVFDSKLYIGYYDNNGVITTGCGLEVMNALTGASLKITKMPTNGGQQLYDVPDICFNSELKEVLAIGNLTQNTCYLYRFNLNGDVIGNSSNIYSQFQPMPYPSEG
ncbi:hypothetical protein [Lysinibacillus xylanilyticus]|uniref:hypothetical protein n=1 Tax=Lysinibacillus xylanilyticus TaxID=582475 RepID=UPI003CFD3129